MNIGRKKVRACAALFLALPTSIVAAPPASEVRHDSLLSGFRNPPDSARPWVWWHWMNGNIDAGGAKLDLEWMKRAGIGGVQLFEGNLETPQLTKRRLVYMSPEWRDALRSSVQTAASLGLEVTIASSPGWSATGGPWVKPEAAMKKLVWSELEIAGGMRFTGELPRPPEVAGPYQDLPVASIEPGQGEGPRLYRDAAVLAYQIPDDPAPRAERVTSSLGSINPKILGDRAFAAAIALPFAKDGTAWIEQDLGRAAVLRSVVVGIPGARGWGAPPAPAARVEVSLDGRSFSPVAELGPSRSPTRSASFAPVRARFVRLVLAPAPPTPGVQGPPPAPGAILPKFPPPPKTYPVSEFRVSGEPRVHRAEEKAGFAALPDFYAVDTAASAASVGARIKDVVDLTAKVRGGRLDWTPPRGKWRIVRIGYSLTGHRNGPAPAEATGLEVDKLNAGHVKDYISTYFAMYRDTLGDSLMGRRGVTSLLSDSIEAGPQNWTEEMIPEFQRRRGYSPIPWLPALTGTVIESAEQSDRFLWDFRRTIAELLAENHYGQLARAAHGRGLTYYAEALEDHRPQLGDDIEMRRHADVPMGAMWMFAAGGMPKPTYVADLRGAASVAHIYGKDLVAAESLTAFGQPWAFAPRDLKSTLDLAFALGVTRPIIHTSAHQPFTDRRRPGLALATSLGQYFTRNETWAEQARGWTDYLARTSYLLRQGRPYADIAYFHGEEAPLTALYGDAPVGEIPSGYGFDFVGADALFNRMSVRDGDLVTKQGVRYTILLLGGSSDRMTMPVLRRIGELAAAGATIVGKRPSGSPSLADDPVEFNALAASIWASSSAIHPNLASALSARRLLPDWEAEAPEGALAVLHRKLAGGDLYFVSNRSAEKRTFDLSFRVTGFAPELWRADVGTSEPLSYRMEGGRTSVPLPLEVDEAVFVVFRNAAAAQARTVPAARLNSLATLTAPWSVSFEPGRGAPSEASFTRLTSLTESAIPGVRYFSGTATYSQEIAVPAPWLRSGDAVLLDLGDVREVAEIAINGRFAGQLWKRPYRLDVSPFLKPGRNRLEVKVTNLWVNRLIGDAQPGAKKTTFTQDAPYTADAPLRTSGLLGPVTLVTRQNAR